MPEYLLSAATWLYKKQKFSSQKVTAVSNEEHFIKYRCDIILCYMLHNVHVCINEYI